MNCKVNFGTLVRINKHEPIVYRSISVLFIIDRIFDDRNNRIKRMQQVDNCIESYIEFSIQKFSNRFFRR